MTKISVVAPCLNEEQYIPVFLNSLASQTFKDFEVVIVDGGSTDNTLHIIEQFKHKLPIRVITDKTPNFGYIRNLGVSYTHGDILFHLNTDNYLPPRLLEEINKYYRIHRGVVSLSGRVHPLSGGLIAHLGYQLFDFLRFVFTCAPCPVKKYRPSGNFMTIRKNTFNRIGGYPHVHVNEDGLIGQKLDSVIKENHKAVRFHLGLYVGHYPKKFESMGGGSALMFYFYTLGNFAPMLQPLLEPIRRNASLVFQHQKPVKYSFKTLVKLFWEWL